MAHLRPQEGFDVLKGRVQETLEGMFPIKGRKNSLVLNSVEIRDNLPVGDIRSQKKAKEAGRSWEIPVNADVSLTGPDGRVIDRKKMRIMNLPKTTGRYSYIVGGTEYQLDNQWVLRPGVYSRVTDSGDLESQFNFKGGGFRMDFDPKTAKFNVRKSSSGASIPLYPLLQEMGVSDKDLEKQWGPEILRANQGGDREKALMAFSKSVVGSKVEDVHAARESLREFMRTAELDPGVTELTLGQKFNTVNGHAMSAAAGKLLGISRGEAKPDARDALMFKRFRAVEDYVSEGLTDRSKEIMRRIGNNIDRKRNVRDVLQPDILNRPIHVVFTKTSLSSTPDQVNPLEMLGGAMKTTITGEKGITSAHRISEDAKLVDPSHFGVLDPMHTPEGDKTGVSLQMAMGAQKRGDTVAVPLFNLKKGKMEMVTPEQIHKTTVVMPDQVRWKGGRPTASGKVKASMPGNDVGQVSLADADYAMRSPTQLFSAASNLIPFMQSTSGNRSTMAGRHMEQAIPLVHREVPLVQTTIDKSTNSKTFNELLGAQSHQRSPVSGEVVAVKNDAVVIRDSKGKRHEVQTYDHFPLNDEKSFLHSEPLVRVGDRVAAKQVVADTNFTRGGQLALGTNLRAGYFPFKGYNYEDGVVISESAAQKLASTHMHRKGVDLDEDHALDKKKYVAHYGTRLTGDQVDKLDPNGVIRVGQVVKPGDTLIAALRKRKKDDDESRMMGRMHKSLIKPFDDVAVRWESDHPGVVTNVIHRGKRAEVHVKTAEPAEIGDKVAGRHGNKGIVTGIFPDDEMPRTTDGKILDIVLNPTGVPGRVNLSQMLETAASKIAEKTGKPYRVQNFDGTQDITARIQRELKAHGLTDKEDILIPEKDPTTGAVTMRNAGQALAGQQYIHKLKHQVGRKLTARSGGPGYAYDRDRMPRSGGKTSAQSMDALGLYAMLAHGATHNIRDMQTYKSNADMNDELWSAIQSGSPLPPPRPTFAYDKFMGYLKGLGINTTKSGNQISLLPMTDKQVLEMSNGELRDPGRMIVGRTDLEEDHGLFDKKVTGGMEGTKWAHISLPERIPNPIFEQAIVGVAGIKNKEFTGIMDGSLGVDPKTGTIVDGKLKGSLAFGQAIEHLLGRIDVKKDLAAAEVALNKPGLTGNRLDQANRRVRYLRVLDAHGMTPTDAYMAKEIPVMPPSMRPLSLMPDRGINLDDLNGMYKGLGLAAKKMREANPRLLPKEEMDKRRAMMYDAAKSLSGLGGYLNRDYRGILDVIRGKTVVRGQDKGGKPAEGFFQKKVIKRRQDLSARGVIVPEPEMGMDEVGFPRGAAMEVYKPFVVRELRNISGMSPLQAQQAVKDGDPLAMRALERVVEQRPMLLKRDPVLHKYGVQAFKPRLISGKAIKVHPLVTSGYNADFDGDQMNAYIPLSEDAVLEARKMHPSNNLFHPATGAVMYTPAQESRLGLYMATRMGEETKKTFTSVAEAAKAVAAGSLAVDAVATIGGKRTTVGRHMVANNVPAPLRDDILFGDPLDKKRQSSLLSEIGRKHKDQFSDVANKLKDIGNRHATNTVFSLGLADITADKKMRDKHVRAADRAVDAVRATQGLTAEQRDAKIVQIYDAASQKMEAELRKGLTGKDNNLVHMMNAGIKPTMPVYRQIRAAPMLMMNAKGEIIPEPIRKSYSEGLDVGDYWTSMSGARKGVVQKVQSVSQPGYVSKQINNAIMDVTIGSDDCGTSKGITLPVQDKEVLDRFLAAPVKSGRRTYAAGTLVTPGVRDSLRNNKVSQVLVRSPLKCRHGRSICATCYGLDENGEKASKGTNVGIISGQALGEPATQMSMRVFHEGGVAPVGAAGRKGAALTDDFVRVKQLIHMYDKIPGSATLSTVGGKVGSIVKNPAGGHDVVIAGVKHYVPHSRGVPSIMSKSGNLVPLHAGVGVGKGDPLSAGPINPHELLPLGGLDRVQNYLADSLYGLYGSSGVRRRNVETVVRSITDVGQIQNPGDNHDLIRGDLVPMSKTREANRALSKAGKTPAQVRPLLRGINIMPKEVRSDWMARLNRERLHETVMDAAARNWSSNIHGTHPIPGIAYGAEFGKETPY